MGAQSCVGFGDAIPSTFTLLEELEPNPPPPRAGATLRVSIEARDGFVALQLEPLLASWARGPAFVSQVVAFGPADP